MKEQWKNNDAMFMSKLIKHKVKCKHCGHVIVMIYRKSCICDWCGHKVYRSEKDEFEEKLRKVIK